MVVPLGIITQKDQSEHFLSYYDIFVRNAFGNYRDILKQISYNAVMAQSLSFLGSKSSAYMWERYRIKASAGEQLNESLLLLFLKVVGDAIFSLGN